MPRSSHAPDKSSSHASDKTSFGRERRPGPARVLATLFVISAITPSTLAQVLELPRPVGPPKLSGRTATAEMIEMLETEMQTLGREERQAEEAERPAVRALITWRILAAELASQGEAAGRDGSISVQLGLRMARNRKEIDRLVAMVGEADGTAAESDEEGSGLAARLEQFNDGAVDLASTIRTVDADELDTSLGRILAPLRVIAEALTETPVVDHWPSRSSVLAMTRGEESDPETGSTLVAQAAIALEESLAAATRWMKPPMAEAYRERLREILATYETEGTRDDASPRLERIERLARIERLEVSRTLIDHITLLREEKVNPRPLAKALAIVDGIDDRAGRGPAGDRPVVTLRLILERMVAYRQREPVTLPRKIRVIRGKLEHAYDGAEKRLLDTVATLAVDPSAQADPAFITLLDDHRQYLADLGWVEQIPEWINAVAAVHPASASGFEIRVTRLGRWLLDRNRRPDAVRAMVRLDRRMTRFRSMPFEAALRTPERIAIVATGGLHGELLAAIGAARTEWVESWSKNDTGDDESPRMLQLAHLLEMMDGTADLLHFDGDVAQLNRWAAWDMPDGLLRRTRTDLLGRLKLATVAATNRDDAQLARQLDRLDRTAPLVRLVGRLLVILGPALRELPDGPASVLGQSMHAPPSDALLLDHRSQLAELCRYAVEAEYAWRNESREAALALQAFINTLAGDIFRSLPRVEEVPS